MNTELNKDTIEVTSRFFSALERLTADKVIRGTKTFTTRYGISRWNFLTMKKQPALCSQFRSAWLMYLVRDYGVNPYWLLLGSGDFYAPGFDAEKVKKLQIDCKKKAS